MKTKIFFTITALILLFTACEKELKDPLYFDGPTLTFSVATGGFGINRDIVFNIIVNDGDNITEVKVTNLGGTNPIIPTPPVGATTTPIPAQAPIVLPVTLDAATGKRRAVFSRTKAELGLSADATAKISLKAEAIVNGNQIFRFLAVNLAGTVTAPVSNYRLTYDKNAATSGYVPMDLNFYTSAGTITVLTNSVGLIKTGSKFVGWNTQADGLGTNYAPRRTFTMGAADRVLFANWSTQPTFAITYSGNGHTNGSVPYDANIYLAGEIIPIMGNIYGLEKAGKIFRGWNTQADTLGANVLTITGVVQVPAVTVLNMPAANTTLYAKWK